MWSLAACSLASILICFVVAYKVPGRNLSIDDSYQVPKLTIDNYAHMTENKTVFIRFFYTRDGHAKYMENGWKRLAKEWDGHAVGLVADVDCTTDRGKALCDLYDEEPNRYPTLKYGDPSALDVYRNDRTYEALSNFAKENLKPICSVDNVEVCDAKEKSQIETYMKLNVEELHTAIKNGKDRFNDAVAKLKEAYMEEYNKLEAGAKVSSRLVKFVLDAKSKDEEEEDFCHGCKVEF